MFPLVAKNLVSRLLPRATIIKAAPLSTTTARLSSDNEMLQVGPWPRTKEERLRAAKKYNLIPEDYEPHDEDEAFGDYPKLKAIGAYNRDSYDNYDDFFDRRFYGEVYHVDADLYQYERIDPLFFEKQQIPVWLNTIVFIGIASAIPLLYWFFESNKIYINHPWKKRYHHEKGQKYYEFPSDH